MDKATLAREAGSGPSSQDLLEAEFGKRKKGVVGWVLAGLVVLAGAAGAGVFFQQQAKKQAANEAWGELSQCLLGEGAGAAESPELAFRRLQLAAMTLPETERGVIEGTPWPRRCSKSALRVIDAAKSAGLGGDGEQSLLHQAELLSKELDTADSFQADLSALLSSSFGAAKAAGLTAAPRQGAPGPGFAAETPLVLEELSKATPLTKRYFPFNRVAVELHQGEDRTFLVQDATVEPPAFFCTPGASALTCRSAPKGISASQTLSLLGTAEKGGIPLLFAGDRGDAGVFFGESGESVDALYASGGWTAPNGTTFLLGWDREDKKLTFVSRAKGEAKAKRAELEPDVETSNYFYNTALLWNHVVIRGVDKEGKRVLVVRDIDVDKRKLGPEVLIGRLPEPGLITQENASRPHIAGCRSKDFELVRVRGRHEDFLAFLVDGKWTLLPQGGVFFDGRLSCSPKGASVTFISPRAVVTEIRCTSAACVSVNADLLGKRAHLAPRDELFDVVTVGDKVVAVWAAGQRGGIRLRVGPATEIASAKDIVLYDDLIQDGKLQAVSSLSDVGLIAGDDHAILLLGTKNGAFALRVDLDGKVAPAKIDWQ